MIHVLVSACLLGEKVRFDGRDAATSSPVLREWLAEGRVVPFCPEVAGGLGVPRPAAEIRGGRVVTRGGEDVTASFRDGAEAALQLARARGVRLAVLKEGSPSCGSGFVYDGSFSGRRVPGEAGVTTALLRGHGIAVFSELELDQAAEHLRRLEQG